jgi:hypothetical protein
VFEATLAEKMEAAAVSRLLRLERKVSTGDLQRKKFLFCVSVTVAAVSNV